MADFAISQNVPDFVLSIRTLLFFIQILPIWYQNKRDMCLLLLIYFNLHYIKQFLKYCDLYKWNFFEELICSSTISLVMAPDAILASSAWVQRYVTIDWHSIIVNWRSLRAKTMLFHSSTFVTFKSFLLLTTYHLPCLLQWNGKVIGIAFFTPYLIFSSLQWEYSSLLNAKVVLSVTTFCRREFHYIDHSLDEIK